MCVALLSLFATRLHQTTRPNFGSNDSGLELQLFLLLKTVVA